MDYYDRLAGGKDLFAINSIYNQAIEHRHQTADLNTFTIHETEKWYALHEVSIYPIFVIEFDRKVVAWSSLSAYRGGRQALSKVAEISYYVDKDFQGIGIGKKIMTKTIESARRYQFNTLVAILLGTNSPSISLLKKFGFSEWGRIPEVAIINDKKVDHLYFGQQL